MAPVQTGSFSTSDRSRSRLYGLYRSCRDLAHINHIDHTDAYRSCRHLDHIAHIDHVDHIFVGRVCRTGSVEYTSNPGNMYVLNHADHPALTRQHDL